MTLASALRTLVFIALAVPAIARTPDGKQKLVLVAGKPSHPAGMHEFNAGVQLLAKCLANVQGLKTEFVLNGWPADEAIFADADAVVFYMDGGPKHEVVQDGGKRLAIVDGWAKRGVGLGFMHYGVEVVADQAGAEFKRWIGGHYENSYSCNPMWEPGFETFAEHPVTRGVKPFTIKDEWYFNMRFVEGFAADGAAERAGVKFTPILVAKPSDATRDGPYVYPKGPYPHIQAAKGRPEAMMWAVERADGGRGVGFTGGHYHTNWGNDHFRKTVLNALAWIAKVEVPADGIASRVSPTDLEANLDPKKK
ncbi:MAG: ThuA domain-containing protein [Chthoniobacteraceae bacterium]